MKSNIKVIIAIVVLASIAAARLICWAQENCNGLMTYFDTSQELCSPLGSTCGYSLIKPDCWNCKPGRPVHDCWATNGYVAMVTVYSNGICQPSGNPPSPDRGVCEGGSVKTNYPMACLNVHIHAGCE